MDFHLNILLHLPNISVFTCYEKEKFTVFKLDLLNPEVSCNYCENPTNYSRQNRPILVRDLSIYSKNVCLNIIK